MQDKKNNICYADAKFLIWILSNTLHAVLNTSDYELNAWYSSVPIYIILLEVLSTEGHILNFSLLVKHEYFIIQTEVLEARSQIAPQKDVAVGVFSNP